MKLFTIGLEFSEKDRNAIHRLTEEIMGLREDLAAAGAAVVASVDGLAERIANLPAGNSVPDADVVTSIQLQQAQASRIGALLQPAAPAPAVPAAPAA